MNTYRPKHFQLEELVPPETIDALGQNAWIVLDPRALVTLDQLRAAYGPCTVNNWHIGGNLRYRGFRPTECTVGAHHSQHRYGRAFDCSFQGKTAQVVRESIMSDTTHFPYLTTLESDVSWVHFDVRDHGSEKILIVHP